MFDEKKKCCTLMPTVIFRKNSRAILITLKQYLMSAVSTTANRTSLSLFLLSLAKRRLSLALPDLYHSLILTCFAFAVSTQSSETDKLNKRQAKFWLVFLA